MDTNPISRERQPGIQPGDTVRFALSCREVQKHYGRVEAVRGVSFDLRHGECFGLLGPNGAGKSTLIQMIYGATSRSGGTMQVLGHDPMTDSRRIKQRLGVVPQDNALDEDMGVRANMMMYARCMGVPSSERATRVDNLLSSMSLAHRANARIRELSGGMQRRLVFVRALLGQPELLILDEPTTGLDPAVRIHLWERIRAHKEQGSTILLTTHYMDEAERLCDRLVIIDQGKARAEGSPRELIQRICPGTLAVFPHREGLREILRQAADSRHDFHYSEDRATHHLRGPNLPELESVLRGLNLQPEILRPSNLEDVFLEITGRELNEHA